MSCTDLSSEHNAENNNNNKKLLKKEKKILILIVLTFWDRLSIRKGNKGSHYGAVG